MTTTKTQTTTMVDSTVSPFIGEGPAPAVALLRFYYSPLDQWCSARWTQDGTLHRYSGPIDGLPLNLSAI